MEKMYFTISGMNFKVGSAFLCEVPYEMRIVNLEKDPKNEHDKEAIKVNMDGLGQIGWVANSVKTIVGTESMSAGRLYDKIGDTAKARVLYIFECACICEIID